jgi:hypothetical protein
MWTGSPEPEKGAAHGTIGAFRAISRIRNRSPAVYGGMSTGSPHQRVARQTDSEVRRNERMIDAVQGLSRQLAETERTLQTFISALSPAAGAAPDRPPADPRPATPGPRPAAAPPQRDAPGGLADHLLRGAHAPRDAGTDPATGA